MATMSDGVVFGEDARDTFEHDWEGLNEPTRMAWRETAEVMYEIMNAGLTPTTSTDRTITH